MHSLWSGSLTFGLVTIPVKVYVAANEEGIDLDMLHKKDFSPIRFARICKKEEKEIPYQEVIKGYEIDGDDYVVLTQEELKKVAMKKTWTIEILHFVKESEIDSIYYERPYYLEPVKGAEKSYALLLEAFKKSGKVGIARFVLSTRERMGAIKPEGNVPVVNQMRYHKDIRGTKDLVLPGDIKFSDKEIHMALSLIDTLTEHFTPQDYRDTYKEELEKLIKAKAKGHTITVKEEKPEATKSEDLMSLLKESIERHRSKTIH